MAISLSQMVLPLNGRYLESFPCSISSSNGSFVSVFSPKPLNRHPYMPRLTRTPVLSKASPETRTALQTMIDEVGKVETSKDKELKKVLADHWLEVHGKNNWAGMLDPIDPLLRSEIIRYGEMAQATYDSFDFDTFSMYYGSCRFPREKFFECLELPDIGYEVTRYLYATSNINLTNFFKSSTLANVWSPSANWIGYIAVSNDETSSRIGRRDITIAWRGTVTRLEWITDLLDYLKPLSADKIPCPDPTIKVESGFVDLYTGRDKTCRFCKYSAREQILTEIRRLKEMYKDENLSITITGHSLGAALAVLSAYDAVEAGLTKRGHGQVIPLCAITFAGPRVGNTRFKERVDELGLKVLRVVNVHDEVPKVPGFVFNETIPSFLQKFVERLPWCYAHVGEELALDHKDSPFLKDTNDMAAFHNLEAYLHLVDGYHGKGYKFASASGRDPALVNKSSEFLKNELLVAPNWRQDQNKGMVRNAEGRWVQPERPKLDDHPSDIDHHLEQLGLGILSNKN